MTDFSNISTLRLHRDEDGTISPIVGISPVLNIPVEVIPLTYGDSRKLESFGEALDDWTDEDKVYLLVNHIKSPELGITSVEDMYDQFDAWTVVDLLTSIFVYSGMGRLYHGGDEGNAEGEAPEEDT